ncbi:MAG: GNAT family N-acetyltransferase [Pseudoflavonifractor sp.]|nr:GNAT family N-acetyltransferase [Pseudoflavonifractor sp.]
MIRPVSPDDAAAIARIYNHYVMETTVSFETKPLTEAAMRQRIETLSASFPYFVHLSDGEIDGYCYVHDWKERAAYKGTMETTVYLAPDAKRQGTGTVMMRRLIDECCKRGYRALIACITAENEESVSFHRHLGFRQVSLFEKVGIKFGRRLDVCDMELLL